MKCIIYRIATDRDGESKVTLVMPQSELPEVLKLSLLLERVLEVDFTPLQEKDP